MGLIEGSTVRYAETSGVAYHILTNGMWVIWGSAVVNHLHGISILHPSRVTTPSTAGSQYKKILQRHCTPPRFSASRPRLSGSSTTRARVISKDPDTRGVASNPG